MPDTPYLQRGIQLYELNRYQEAINNFQQALQEQATNFHAKYYLAHCYVEINLLDKASDIAKSLLSETPDNAEVFALLSWIRGKENKDKEALIFIEKAIAIDPFDADYFGQQGYVLLSLKRYDEALIAVDQGLSINARHKNCLNARGIILTKLNRKEEAATAVENVLRENPESHFSHASSGWVALEHGKTKKALKHFKEALQLNPNSEHARSGMSIALKSKNLVYRAYLKYAFWMSNMSTKNQWIFIIGIYLAYRFGVKLLENFNMAYLAIPLIVLYLFFALGGWIMEPMANSILNFDRYGKYLLKSRERISGYLFLGLFLAFLAAAVGYYISNNDYLLLLGAVSLCTILPLTHGILLDNKKSRILSILYSMAMVLVGFGSLAFTFNPVTSATYVLVMMVLYTWLGNVIK